jgi:hypothetical protein
MCVRSEGSEKSQIKESIFIWGLLVRSSVESDEELEKPATNYVVGFFIL